MGLNINSLDDLQKLLAQLDVKVTSVEEVKGLFEMVRSSYNPEADRIEVARLLAIIPSAVAFGVAGLVTFFLVAGVSQGKGGPGFSSGHIALAGIVWGTAALASILGGIMAMIVLVQARRAEARGTAGGPPAAAGLPHRSGDAAPRGAEPRPASTHITGSTEHYRNE